MKLQRFIAENIQRAIDKIQATLGPDAMIHSTRSIDNGIEILASNGSMDAEELNSEMGDFIAKESGIQKGMIEQLSQHLQLIDNNLQRLSQYISTRSSYDFHLIDDELSIKKNLLFYHLNKIGFRGRFCQKFVDQYLKLKHLTDHINEETIKNTLITQIKSSQSEFVDDIKICALIGPTGVGKTTTIAKLAKRYISRYGEQGLGFITTDYSDLVGKNQLVYYSRLFNVDLEYVNDAKDLEMVLAYMKKKKLILIDTHGVSQRDSTTVHLLLELLESQGDKISSYITLPCNVQEPILDEIARAFNSTTLKGCILTKQDESISMAPSLSVAMNYDLEVNYICDGQDISTGIKSPNPNTMIHHIINESEEMKSFTEKNLVKNIERVTTCGQKNREACIAS